MRDNELSVFNLTTLIKVTYLLSKYLLTGNVDRAKGSPFPF